MMAEMLDEIANAKKKKKLNKHLLNWDTVGFCFVFLFFLQQCTWSTVYSDGMYLTFID